MNKLDEILEQFQKAIIASNDFYGVEEIREVAKKQAKQAIIKLIEGEIIGEDEIYVEGMSDEFIERTATRNDYRRIQRQKLQKLKD